MPELPKVEGAGVQRTSSVDVVPPGRLRSRRESDALGSQDDDEEIEMEDDMIRWRNGMKDERKSLVRWNSILLYSMA